MPHPERSNSAYRWIARFVRPAMAAMLSRTMGGVENLHQPGGFIAVANHVTNLDPITFAHFLYDNGIAPRILAKSSLFGIKGLGRLLRSTGQIPVHRGTSAAGESLTSAVEALAAGEVVVVFPEGTLTREPDLWPMQGKTGIARLALTTKAPVVPVAQWGAHFVLGRYKKVPKPFPRKKLRIVAGPPVDLSDLYDKPQDAAVLREATERVMVAITALLEEIRGEKAPAERFVWRRSSEGTA
ncbi:MAG: 1-acyl-sn-glycerol-3-phosphate acyltransferase [Cellulomonadaceae bacterium]|nr:1-acyl-sn-glycerol-3-phosphate acyltransferase [Cellulomonadaceae bacterium]